MGAPFLEDNGINIDIKISTLSTVPLKHSENLNIPERLVIQPRTETLVPIITNDMDGITSHYTCREHRRGKYTDKKYR